MKTESPLLMMRELSPVADAFQAFFDMVNEPAALMDAQLSVMAANAAFEVLVGSAQVVGQPFSAFFQCESLLLPEPQQTKTIEVLVGSVRPVALTISRRGDCFAIIAKRTPLLASTLEETGNALLARAEVEKQLLELGRAVTAAANEESLVAVVAASIKALFPSCVFSVRFVEPRTAQLTSLYAEGRLRNELREQFFLRRSMLEITHLDINRLPDAKVHLVQGDVPLLFHGSVRGISTPLVANGQLFGALNVEYVSGSSNDLMADERTLIQVANQVAVAVRNVKLIDELTFTRRYLEDLIEHANALILVLNADMRVLVANRAFHEVLGVRPVIGTDASLLFPIQDWTQVKQALLKTLSGQPAHHFEARMQSKDGETKRVAFSTSLVLKQTGEVEGVMAIGQDLTRVRQLETQVVQAEKLASLGQLAATVAHEINNPMTAVSTYADVLLSRAQTEQDKNAADVEKLRRIVENSERVLRFTRNLVSYARPASDTLHPVYLSDVLQHALRFCEHVFAKHGVTVEPKLLASAPVLGVAQNLTQVFVNLLTNACHASPPGGQVKLESWQDKEYVFTRVSDRGHGMSEVVRQRLFQPFFTTKTDGKGTGLGLSIVAQIVERHNGLLDVDSEPGVGTSFTLKLRKHGKS
jgi:two-component system, NtrC family, sensor kinase